MSDKLKISTTKKYNQVTDSDGNSIIYSKSNDNYAEIRCNGYPSVSIVNLFTDTTSNDIEKRAALAAYGVASLVIASDDNKESNLSLGDFSSPLSNFCNILENDIQK